MIIYYFTAGGDDGGEIVGRSYMSIKRLLPKHTLEKMEAIARKLGLPEKRYYQATMVLAIDAYYREVINPPGTVSWRDGYAHSTAAVDIIEQALADGTKIDEVLKRRPLFKDMGEDEIQRLAAQVAGDAYKGNKG